MKTQKRISSGFGPKQITESKGMAARRFYVLWLLLSVEVTESFYRSIPRAHGFHLSRVVSNSHNSEVENWAELLPLPRQRRASASGDINSPDMIEAQPSNKVGVHRSQVLRKWHDEKISLSEFDSGGEAATKYDSNGKLTSQPKAIKFNMQHDIPNSCAGSLSDGVSWNASDHMWSAYINIGTKTASLGKFASKEEALLKYNEHVALLVAIDPRPMKHEAVSPTQTRLIEDSVSDGHMISSFTGVTYHATNKKWVAQIRVDGKRKNLGYFTNQRDAAHKYDEHAAPLRRPINFPKGDQIQAAKGKTLSAGTIEHAPLNILRVHTFMSTSELPMTMINLEGNLSSNTTYSLASSTPLVSNNFPNTHYKSIFKGVSWNKANNKWISQIRMNGKSTNLGRFEDEISAAKRYDEYALLLGRPLNFPKINQEQAVKGPKLSTSSESPDFQRSSYAGVFWEPQTSTWISKISIGGKIATLGHFLTEELAAQKYDEHAFLVNKPLNFLPSKTTSTVFVGVSYDRANMKWRAQMLTNGKRNNLGYYETDIEAATKYDEFASRLGLPVNFPGEGQKKAIKRSRTEDQTFGDAEKQTSSRSEVMSERKHLNRTKSSAVSLFKGGVTIVARKKMKLENQQRNELEIQYSLQIQEARRLRDVRKRISIQAPGEDLSMATWAEAAGLLSSSDITKRLRSGNEAKRALVEMNMPLVRMLLKKYRPSLVANGIMLQDGDLEQEGIIGLVRATEKFKPELGYRFSTYAKFWIRANAINAMKRERAVRVPDGVHIAYRRIMKFQAEASVDGSFDLNSPLNDKQLAESLSTSIDFVRRVKSAFNTRVWSYDKSLKETSNELNPTSFLDKMSAGPSEGVFSGGETDFEEFSGESSGSQLRLGLERILEDFVDPFEMKVVRMLYGLDDGKSRNVEEIARKLGKAADEVRNARSAAFTKLRKHVCLEEAVRS